MRVQQTRAAVSGGSSAFFLAASSPTVKADRRKQKRIPRTFGIQVQPLKDWQDDIDNSFFAITRDISHGGLAYLSPYQADFETAIVTLEEDMSRSVVAKICDCNLVHASDIEKVYLTNVEFLYETFV